MKSKLVLALLLFVFAPLALADDGYIVSTGAALNYGKNRQVQMVSEKVVIKLFDDSAEIDATFRFKNLGPATTVSMGFPEESEDDQTSIYNFKSEVDGKRLRVRRILLTGRKEFNNYHKAIWLKKVHFAEGQTRTVRVRYESDNSVFTSGERWQQYVLRTGATWSGRIQKCELKIDFSGLKSPYGAFGLLERDAADPGSSLYPAVWRPVGNRCIATTLINIEPDFDLTAHVLGGFWKFKINSKVVPTINAAYDVYPAFPLLEGSEVLLPPMALRGLFGKLNPDDPNRNSAFVSWGNPDVPFGPGDEDYPHGKSKSLKLPSGKVIKLAHPAVMRTGGYEPEPTEMVRLSDVVRGMGGTYRYDRASGFVLIDFPRH